MLRRSPVLMAMNQKEIKSFFFLEGKQKFERKIEIRVRGKGNTNTDNMICEKLEAFLNR